MADNTTMQTTAEESVETSSAFDEGWDEVFDVSVADDGQDAYDEGSEEPETADESEDEGADADQQDATEDEGGETDDSESEGSGDEGTPDQGEFVLKYLGEERSVGRDEVVTLAQKGMDYDRIREKWDSVKDSLEMYQAEHAFLQELAEARGGDINGLMDETRTRTFIARAEAKGETLTPAEAAAMAVRARMEGNGTAIEPEEARKERSQREVDRFLKEYPDVRAEDVPPEVWEQVNANDGDLVGTYRAYENRQLKAELKKLQKDLEDAKQQTKNKARSTGSTKSVGSAATIDPFDSGWDEAY